MVFLNSGEGVARASVSERFFTAWTSAGDPATATVELLPARLCRAMALVLGVADAGISVLDGDVRVPLGASSDTAENVEKLQFTLGEGPCLQALRTGVAVVATADEIAVRWPAFFTELCAASSYRSVVALPVQVAPDAHGAVDLYLHGPNQAREVSLADADAVVSQVSAALAVGAAASPSRPQRPGPSWLYGPQPRDRMMVWVALGMIRSRHHVHAGDALALLRAYAYSHDQVLDDVAAELVHKTLPLHLLTP